MTPQPTPDQQTCQCGHKEQVHTVVIGERPDGCSWCRECDGFRIPTEPTAVCPEWNPHNVQPGYCYCGCGGRTRVYNRNYHDRGLKKGTPALYLKHHKGRTNFIINERGCWVWQGKPDSDGYACTHWDMRSVKVYRAMYEMLRGPIPDGAVMDHLCREKMCVNPYHLEAVTNAVNIRRGRSTALTPLGVEAIKASSLEQVQLATKYGVHVSTINRIKRGKRWAA